MKVELQGSVRLNEFWMKVADELREGELPEDYAALANWTVVVRPATRRDRSAPTGGCFVGYDPGSKRAAYGVTVHEEEDQRAGGPAFTVVDAVKGLIWQLAETIETHELTAFGDV